MNEGTVFHTQPVERVQEGMTVVDAAGEKLGTVAYVKMGDPQAVTTQGNEPGQPGSIGEVPLAVTGEREPDVPEPLRSQLLRSGFIKVDRPGLLAADRYVPGDRIGDVSGDTVTLRQPGSATVHPEDARLERGGIDANVPDDVAAIDAAAAGDVVATGPEGAAPASEEASRRPSRGVVFSIGGGSLAAIGAGGAWLYRRWQRERNRPSNRLRRRVRQAVAAPTWPAGGLGAALAALALSRALRARAGGADGSTA